MPGLLIFLFLRGGALRLHLLKLVDEPFDRRPECKLYTNEDDEVYASVGEVETSDERDEKKGKTAVNDGEECRVER